MHLRTYNTIFQHPVSHNLAWRVVHSLLRHGRGKIVLRVVSLRDISE